jgi:hypothetical protein
MEPRPYAYFVEADEQPPDAVRASLARLQLSETWLRILELTVAGRRLLMLELFDLETGAPVDVQGLGEALSGEDRSAIFLAEDPSDKGGAFEVYRAGEQRFAWGGTWEEFEDEANGTGRQGFLRTFTALTGLDWSVLASAAAEPRRFAEVADDHTELLLRGRILGIPEGMPRYPELFKLHYIDEIAWDDDEYDEDASDEDESDYEVDDEVEDEVEDDGDSEGSERLLLLLLDLELGRFLWEEAPAAQVTAFLKAIEPVRGAVLGPLAHALPDVINMVQAQTPDRPLASSPLRELLVFELLSVATAVGYLAGDTVDYYDQRFFPLLNLADGAVAPEAVRSSLTEIQDMDVLSAMVEVLPYSAPEGELLESFGDDELNPPAAWAEREGIYEGSLFHLDTARLRERVADFNGEQLSRRVDEFRRVWADVLPPGNEWHAGEEDLDEAELARFEHMLNELRLLLALADVNDLQPAVLFYGD